MNQLGSETKAPKQPLAKLRPCRKSSLHPQSTWDIVESGLSSKRGAYQEATTRWNLMRAEVEKVCVNALHSMILNIECSTPMNSDHFLKRNERSEKLRLWRCEHRIWYVTYLVWKAYWTATPTQLRIRAMIYGALQLRAYKRERDMETYWFNVGQCDCW